MMSMCCVYMREENVCMRELLHSGNLQVLTDTCSIIALITSIRIFIGICKNVRQVFM